MAARGRRDLLGPLGEIGPCELCGSSDFAALFEKNGYWLVRCNGCRLVLAHPRPSLDDLERAYTAGEVGAGAPTGDPKEFQAYEYRFRAFLELVKSLSPPGRILDVGCWNGQFLSQLGPEWDKHGVELSKSASEYARTRSGLRVVTGTIHDVHYPDSFFDCITMWDVIEHVPSPRADLKRVVDLLDDEGKVFISTPDLGSLEGRILGKNWPVITPPGHLTYFTRSTIERLFDLVGLKLVFWRRTEIPQYLPKFEIPSIGSLVHNRFTEFLTKRSGITLGPTMKVVGKKLGRN